MRGFSLARQVSIRGGLELLAVAYNFDGVESDFQLKFQKRGSSSIRVITQNELAYVSDPGSPVPEPFGETRAQDIDLPARFTVRYNDIERDADIGVQTVDGPRNIGGRIRALEQDPINPATLYAGSAFGGLWKTENAGDTWQALGSFVEGVANKITAPPIGTIGICRRDPSTVYVGTGEQVGYQFAGSGLYRSRDGGASFQRIAAVDPAAGSGRPGRPFAPLRAHPG